MKVCIKIFEGVCIQKTAGSRQFRQDLLDVSLFYTVQILPHMRKGNNALLGFASHFPCVLINMANKMTMAKSVDPYKALGLGHDASPSQIRNAYRKLALRYHPDRMVARQASPSDRKEASDKFVTATLAHAMLSDTTRKREYDHICKYGGFDDVSVASTEPDSPTVCQDEQNYPRPSKNQNQCFKSSSHKKREKGIGIMFSDPLSCFGGTTKKAHVAGIQIPPRLHVTPKKGGFRFVFTSGECTTSNGIKKSVSRTTQVIHGKKFSRVITTTIHPDGRREIVVTQGKNIVERRSTGPSNKRKTNQLHQQQQADEGVASRTADDGGPWYMHAWQNVRDRLTMCHSPCGKMMVQ